MASLFNLTNALKGLATELINNREQDSIVIASDTMALVRLRVQTDKEDADGLEFGQYSEAVVPQWMLYGKSLSDGAESKIKDGEWFQSYSDLREANNLETDAIDFTFSGDMWRNTGITNVQNTGFSTTVNLGGQTDRASDIIGYQEERYGNIIAISDEEEQLVVEAHEERISNLINKYFG